MSVNMRNLNIKPKIIKTLRIVYIRTLIDFFILTLLATIVFRNWLFTSEWPAGGDVMGWISRAYLWKDLRWLYIWRPWAFGFPEDIHLIDLFMSPIYYICNDPALTVKIFTFLSFLIAGLTIYIFTYSYTRRNLAAFSASIVYCFNPWLFSQLTEAHIDIIFSYALAPLIFLMLNRALKKGGLKNITALGLSLTLIMGFHRECAVIYGFFLALYVVFYLIHSLIGKSFLRQIKHLVKTVVPSLALALTLSTPSLLPQTILDVPYYSASFGYPIEDAFQVSYKNMIDAFTLRAHESWGYESLIDVRSELGLPEIPVTLFSLIVFALSYFIILFHRSRNTVFFVSAAIISAFIAKGPHPPFGGIFIWMWFNIPRFAIFRAASRAAMMTAFSHAFMVSVFVATLTNYINISRKCEAEETYIKVKVRTKRGGETEEVYVSMEALNRILKGMRKIIRALGILLIIFIVLNSIFSCFYFFNYGLQVYTPPEKYLEPYNLISSIPGDYKIITISNSPSEWESLFGMPVDKVESDFAFGGMLTQVGWTHDIGYDSSFIHDKPILQDGGWSQMARFFLDHLRFRAVRQLLSDDLLKILGTFNYKYTVLPSYITNETQTFFLNQKGYTTIYNGSSIILQNNYYTPRFFVTNQYAYVVGGLETFISLCKLDNFNLNKTALLFLHNLHNSSPLPLSDENQELYILMNTDVMDMLMTHLQEDVIFIEAANYGARSLNYSRYWCRGYSWRHVGSLVLGGETLTTCGKNSISIPFKTKESETYEIWMRIGFTDYRGKLDVKIDGKEAGEIKPLSNYWSGLKWVKIATLRLNEGEHIITLTNDGTGFNDVDVIAIVKPQVLQSKINELLNTLQDVNSRIVYVLEAENIFTYNLSSNWHVALKPYEGYIISLENHYKNISPTGKASASSSGTWGEITLWPYLANDGDPNTRWASNPYEPMPQWLMIEWDSPQKISGVHIAFERARAVDYRVQTWNGTAWIDQAVIEGNTFLERTHMFNETVETTKVRIYVTRVTELYNLVSIWELETFTELPPLSAEIFIPRDGYYVFAHRIIEEDGLVAPLIKVDEQTIAIKRAIITGNITWYEGNPIYLKVGEHKLKLSFPSLTGKINLDQIVVYSLKHEKEKIDISDLFKSPSTPLPCLEYEKLNPCEYIVHVKNSTGPFMLVFSESYHPLWRAFIEGKEIDPIPIYSMINGFYINKTGDFSIKIYFKGQTYAEYGLKISGATLILLILVLAIPSNKLKKISLIPSKIKYHRNI